MSRTVDERVVSMEFDNKHFENNVKTSLNTLDKLKQSLNLSGAAKGLENVSAAARGCDLSPISNGAEIVHAKFSALQVMAVTALANITNSAVNAGKRIASALTIEPIKMGLQEYETQINAVQTILANTKSKGTTLDQVNSALDELNHYADKTIYNFTEMTRNIGTFTAAGIDLDTSVNAIQGIANLAAVSGSNSQQASTAMYQLSQALATGTVKLMDWNSVVNAGMGGQIFQDALKETSKALGTGAEQAIKAKGSFRESLQTGWLTAEVLTETLKKFTTSGAQEYVAKYTGLTQDAIKAELEKAEATYGEAEAIEYASKALAEKSGKNADEIKQILDFAKNAEDAATKVKTFSQLIDTLKEALQSGWTQSWEIIIGDFEEAKKLWTSISDYFGDAINKSAEARNNLLQAWKDGGGRDMLFEGIKNAFNGVLSVIKPIKEAFKDIFPPTTAKNLLTITERFKDFTANLVLSKERADKVKLTFKGLFSILDLGKKAISAVLKPILSFVTGDSAGSIADKVLDITASIGDFFTKLNEGVEAGEGFSKVSSVISGALETIGAGVSAVVGCFGSIGEVLSKAWSIVSKVVGKIRDVIGEVFSWLRENISAGDIFAGLAGGGIFIAFKKFGSLIDKIKDIFDGFFSKKDVVKKFSDIMSGIKDSLSSFSEGLKVSSILGISIAVALLSSSLKKISDISPGKIAYSLGTIRLLIASLTSGFSSLCKSLKLFGGKGTIRAGIALIAIAEAVNILASAMIKIKDLSWEEIAKGLASVGGSVLILTKAINHMGSGGVSLRTSIAILALAESCKKIADALIKFGSMSWDEIGRGLTAMGGALTEFTAVLSVMGKFGGSRTLLGGLSILIASKSLDDIADALKNLGDMQWDEIGRGLTAMGGALAELGGVTGALGKLAGFSGILGSASLVIAVESLDEIAEALTKFGNMSWSEIGRGLSAMGGALLEVGGMSGALGVIAGFSGLFGAGSLVIAVQGLEELADSLIKFGSMSWDEIGRGLTAMGGALLEVGGVSGALGALTGFAGIIGAGTIDLAVEGLDTLANCLIKFGDMAWDEIGRGLVAMGGALLEIGGISGGLGALTGIAGLVGAGTITLAVQGLDQLAEGLIKFGSMSWDEIGRGLVAMGAALGEIALGSLANSLGILGSISIEKVAEPLGVLADSFKKFCGMNWEEVSVGIEAMSAVLSELAVGGFLNTLSILGSVSIATVAEPLGILADSVKKWIGMSIPEDLAYNLSLLAGAILSFTFSGLGGIAISTVAGPLGTLADSVRNWSGVTVPENLNSDLTGLAEGIKGFSWLFLAGWSLSALSGPLGSLADSVRKWSGITVSEGLKESLTNLSAGLKGFSWLFTSGWSISAIVKPLGELANSVNKWTGITVPESLKDGLKDIADGIKEFSAWDALKISGIAEPLNTLSNACKKLSSINVDGEKLKTFVSNLNRCCNDLSVINSASVLSASNTVSTLCEMFKKINGVNVGNVENFVKAANSLNNISVSNINVDTGSLKNAVSSISEAMKSMKSIIVNSKSSLNSGMKTAMSGLPSAIQSSSAKSNSAMRSLLSSLANSVSGYKSNITSAFKTMVSGASKAIRSHYSSMKSAGKHLGSGLVSGIESKEQAAYDAGFTLGQAAVQGEKDGQQSNSPSKLTIKAGKWIGEGLIIGMQTMANRVYDSGKELGTTATGTISSAISKIANNIDGDMNMQPTIRPVLDLSDVKSGARNISSILGNGGSIQAMANVDAISRMANRRNQNGANDDVVSAIDKLRKDVGNLENRSYSVGNITYSGGDEVSNAIESLVRAIVVEGRV